MDMPSRIEIRRWLVEHSRDEIIGYLKEIKLEHGVQNEQDVRDFLNYERQEKKPYTPAEKDLQSLKALHQDIEA